MKEKREIVYLKADRNSVCHDPKIKIQDVMSVQCADSAICAGIKNKTLYTFKKNDGQKKEGKKKKAPLKQGASRGEKEEPMNRYRVWYWARDGPHN